jgi:glycerol-3-phosphate dehydrogenase
MSVLEIAEKAELETPMVPGLQPIAAEAVYCARHEMALHLSDLLSRRTRLALTDAAAGIGDHSRALSLLAAEHGWDAARAATEKDSHREEIEHERGLPLGREPSLEAPQSSNAGA